PTRSETAPIGTATASSVRPNDPNSRPIIVGVAPSRWLRSGSTGTAIEYATMSVNVAHVTRATATERESRKDMGNSRRQLITKRRRPRRLRTLSDLRVLRGFVI